MNAFSLWLTHAAALTLKETRQILRDKSAILLGVFMPLMLIILFGYGLSFDVRNIRLGVVDMARTEQTERITASLVSNESFKTTVYAARGEALKALENFEIEALAVFEKKNTSTVSRQIVVDGIDAPRATMIVNAVSGAAGIAMAGESDGAGIIVVPRIWFNESVISTWYLVPGLFVIVLTLTGCMMTSLVLAREWERVDMDAKATSDSAGIGARVGARHDGGDDCNACFALGHPGEQDFSVLLPGHARLGAVHVGGLFPLRSAGARQLLDHFGFFGFVPVDGAGTGTDDFRRDSFAVSGFSGHGFGELFACRDSVGFYL